MEFWDYPNVKGANIHHLSAIGLDSAAFLNSFLALLNHHACGLIIIEI